MGVPTLTLEGSTPAGRDGATVLRHVGLDSFVAEGKEQFVEMGLRWAGDLDALAEIRSGLRERFAKSPISHPEVIAASMAEAFRIIWRRWCAGLPPEAF
jgi:predicted O-linked N-acetylglucosamine transferase (SPINDLY family)